jgi:two-component sensor histidine kinase
MPAWQPAGEKHSSHYGYSLQGLGDVNGDGFGDIAVGAWGFESERPESGRVYVYLGGPSGPSTVPSWVLSGLHTHQRLGAAVFAAGDVDGDGFADLLVGATGAANPETYEGQILLFHGSPSGLSTEARWTFEPNIPAFVAGHSIATAGDINGDGFPDIVVSSMVGQIHQPGEGAVFVFLGSRGGPSRDPDWVFAGGEPNGGYGATVRPAGDVNQDGYDDLLVGHTYHSGHLFQQGAAWIHYGGPGGLRAGLDWPRSGGNLGFRYRSVTLPMPTFLGRVALGGLIALAAVSAGLGIHRRTLRRQRSLQQAAQSAQQSERARLSQDLHDQLGADMTHLVVLSSVMRRNLATGKGVEDALLRLETVSRSLMDSLSEIVWLTQPRNDCLERVASYLGDLAQKMLEPAEIRCSFKVQENLPDLQIGSDCRHDLVLAVREALSNAVRHSGTETIRIHIRVECQELRIDLEDFGTGFAEHKPSTRGHGLQNLAHRLERHGGRADIHTRPGGTRVCLRLPLAQAPVAVEVPR